MGARKPPQSPEQRLLRALRSMAPGSMNGRVASAAPMTVDQAQFAARARALGSPGPTLNTLPDVDPTGLADGAVPTWDAAAKDYKIAAPGGGGSHTPVPKKDAFTVASTPATMYELTYLPLTNSINLSLNGIELEESVDYTVNYGTGVVTVSASLIGTPIADVLTADYWTNGTLVTSTSSLLLDYVGAFAETAGNWVMSSMTVGARVGGVWTYQSPAPEQLIALGLADAYSVQTTVGTKPSGTSFFFYDWFAGWGRNTYVSTGGLRQDGIHLQTDNSTMTLYLRHNTTVVLSTSYNNAPIVGDVVEVVTDFTTKLATASINGTTIATVNFSGQAWYTADGSLA